MSAKEIAEIIAMVVCALAMWAVLFCAASMFLIILRQRKAEKQGKKTREESHVDEPIQGDEDSQAGKTSFLQKLGGVVAVAAVGAAAMLGSIVTSSVKKT